MKRADRSRKRWWGAAAFSALVGLLTPLPAWAQAAGPLELTWRVPSTCPSAQQVRQRVRNLLGTGDGNVTPLQAAATIARTPDGRLQLTLVTRLGDSLGERRVEGGSCEDLTNAAAIHLALLLKAAGSPREVTEQEEPPVQATPKPMPQSPTSAGAASATIAAVSGRRAPAELQPSAVESAASRAIQLIAQLPLASLELGPLSRPSLGLALGAGLGVAAWRLSLEGQLWLPQTLPPTDAGAGPGAELERISAGVRACRALLPGPVTLAPCMRLGFEHMWARGTGPHLAARTATASWLAFGVGVQARLRVVSWLGLVAQLDGQFASARPRVTVSGAEDLGQRGRLAISLSLGLEWIL